MGTGWWIADLWQAGQTVQLVSWIFWVIFSICLHELAHGVAAIWEGDQTPRITGHMTWNPLVHMGGMSLLLFAFIGFAWGMMPVNPNNFRHQRFGEAIVAFAGPLVNLVLAIILLSGSGLWSGLVSSKPEASQWTLNASVFLWTGGWINLILLALNLLPFPPLDGSRILGSFSYGLSPAAHEAQFPVRWPRIPDFGVLDHATGQSLLLLGHLVRCGMGSHR